MQEEVIHPIVISSRRTIYEKDVHGLAPGYLHYIIAKAGPPKDGGCLLCKFNIPKKKV